MSIVKLHNYNYLIKCGNNVWIFVKRVQTHFLRLREKYHHPFFIKCEIFKINTSSKKITQKFFLSQFLFWNRIKANRVLELKTLINVLFSIYSKTFFTNIRCYDKEKTADSDKSLIEWIFGTRFDFWGGMNRSIYCLLKILFEVVQSENKRTSIKIFRLFNWKSAKNFFYVNELKCRYLLDGLWNWKILAASNKTKLSNPSVTI